MAAGVKNVDANVETTLVPRPAKRRLWLQIAAAVLVPVVVLVIVEVSLRIAGVGFSTSLLVPCAVKGTPASCYDVVLRIAEGLADQKPDLFIVYSGNNEVVGPYGPGTMLTSVGMSMPAVRANIFFRSTRIGQLVTKLGTKKREWHGMEMFLDQQVRASSPLMQQAYADYEDNLRDTIRVAQAVGAKVIVSTVATNLKDCAPFASLPREGLSPADIRTWSTFMTVAQYQWAIAQNPDDGMLHLRFGTFLFLYHRAAAAEQIGLAQPWDGHPMFLPDGTQVR